MAEILTARMLSNSNTSNVAAAMAMAAAAGSNHLQHTSPQLQLPTASPAPAHQLPPSVGIPGSGNQSTLQPSLYMLQWHEHHTSFFQLMEELCQSQTMTDVTVACGDVSLEAHSLILSASSPILRSILNKGRGIGQKQTLHFMDMNPHHMQLLLQYMYRGEVSVHQSELGPLMQSAKALQIKGLSGGNSDEKINDFATFLAGATSSQQQKPVLASTQPGMTNTTNISPTGAPPINVPAMPPMMIANDTTENLENKDSLAKKRKFPKEDLPQNLTSNVGQGEHNEKGRRKSRLSRTGKNSPPVQQQASPTSTSTDNHNVPSAHQQQHHGLLNAQAVKLEMDNSQQHPGIRNNEVGVVVDDDLHGYSGIPATTTTTTQAITAIPSNNPQQGNNGGTASTVGPNNMDDSQSGGSVMENWSDQPTMKVKGHRIPVLPKALSQMKTTETRSYLSRLIWATNDWKRPQYGNPDTKPIWWPNELLNWSEMKKMGGKKSAGLTNVNYNEIQKNILYEGYKYFGFDPETLWYEAKQNGSVEMTRTQEKLSYILETSTTAAAAAAAAQELQRVTAAVATTGTSTNATASNGSRSAENN